MGVPRPANAVMLLLSVVVVMVMVRGTDIKASIHSTSGLSSYGLSPARQRCVVVVVGGGVSDGEGNGNERSRLTQTAATSAADHRR